MALPVLPDVIFAPKPTRAAINRTVSPADGVIPVGYGRFMTEGHMGPVAEHDGELVVCVFFCWGECEEIETVYLNDELPPVGVTVHTHTGTTSQTVDSLLSAAIPDFAEDYVLTINGETRGICYCVVSVPEGAIVGFPRVTAVVKGMKVFVQGSSTYGDRSTCVYSTNPCHCLFDFCASTLYGAGLTMAADSASLYGADEYCDDDSLGEVRRRIGLLIQNIQDTTSWLETMRAYAGCMIVRKSGVIYFVPDKVTGSTASFDADNIVDRPISIIKKSKKDVPTVVRVTYTDTSQIPWRDATATAKRDGVDAGILPWRESAVSLPGIDRYSQAYREAVERLNAATLTDIGTKLFVFDEGLEVERGDVITVTHPIGLAAKEFRVLDMSALAIGRWELDVYEYDPGTYSDVIETTPSTSDTNLPDPSKLPAVTGLVLTEEVFQRRDGTWGSRISITWDDAGLRAGAAYRVNIYSAGVLHWTSTTKLLNIASPEVTELQQYIVEVYAELAGFVGIQDTEDLTPQGKYLIPGDVPSIDGYEAGGEVRLWWSAAVDKDIWRYEIRYGAVTDEWEDAEPYDQVDGLRATLKDIPEGTYRFFIKAIDSVKQESVTAVYVDIEVTADYRAFLVGSFTPVNPDLTEVHDYRLNEFDGDTHYVSATAVSWETLFPSAMNTYTDELGAYFDDQANEWLSEVLDFGAIYTGNIVAVVPVDFFGASDGTVVLETCISFGAITGGDGAITGGSGAIPSGDGGSWDTNELSAKVTARYARIRIATTSGNTFHCKTPGISVRFNVITTEESGESTSSATGATTVTLGGNHKQVKSIFVTPLGTAARAATVNNVQTT